MVPYKQEVEELNKPPVHAFLSAFFLSFLLHSVESCWEREGRGGRREREREMEGKKGRRERKREIKNGNCFDPLTTVSQGENRHEKSRFKRVRSELQLGVLSSGLFMYLSGAFNLLSIYHL